MSINQCAVSYVQSGWVVSMHTWRAQKATKPVMHASLLQGEIVRVQKQTSLIWWHSLWYLSAVRAVWFEIWVKLLYSKQNRKSSAPHGGLSLYDATKHRQDVLSQWLHKTRTLLPVCVSHYTKTFFHVFLWWFGPFLEIMQWLNQMQSNHREANDSLFNRNLRLYVLLGMFLLDMIHIWIYVMTFCMPAWC